MSSDQSSQSIAVLVREEIARVGAEQGKALPPLDGSLPLLDSGLDSLCIAILVARLEDRLGFDPFSGDGPVTFPVTIGDFVAAYEHAPA